jgi:hypothetical protein
MTNTIDQGIILDRSIQAVTNDPDPYLIGIYAVGFLVAIFWNLYAYYKLFRLDHVKRELDLKQEAGDRESMGRGQRGGQGLWRHGPKEFRSDSSKNG